MFGYIGALRTTPLVVHQFSMGFALRFLPRNVAETVIEEAKERAGKEKSRFTVSYVRIRR